MKTQQFLTLLTAHPAKELIFEYAAGKLIPNAYHITEVKNVHIESVDCGGRPAEYYQTIIQLWIGDNVPAERSMTAEKALKILQVVDRKKPLRRATELFIEYGYGDLRTANYQIENIVETADKMIVQLYVAPTICKPKFELELTGGQCGPGCC